MRFSKLRLPKCAALLLALVGAPAFVVAQTFNSVPTVAGSSNDSDARLPDAPSFSSSQQAGPQQASPAQPPQTAPPPNETEEQRKIRLQHEEAERQVKEQEKQRIGGIIPNFNVRMGGPFVPLSPAQKWSLSLHTIIDPYTFGLAFVIGGGLGEAEDDHTGYHWGTAGYFKRTAASYADNVDGNLIGNALFPIIFHQDPRYFRKGTGSIKSRVLFSAMSTFICHGDNGKTQFNFSNVSGNFVSGAISNVYYPSDETGLGLTIDNAIVVTLEGMLGAQLLEFSPDVTDYIHKRRQHHRLLQLQKIDATTGAQSAAPPTTPPAAPPQP